MTNDTLYEDERLRITYLHSPEPGRETEVVSRDEHELWINQNGEWFRYILQRGVLEELACDARERRHDDLVVKLQAIDPYFRFGGMTFPEFENALMNAHQKEEEEFETYLQGKQRQ